MLPKKRDEIYVQCYKHDESRHRTWAKGYVIEANESRIVTITDKAWVIESDMRKWLTREPAINVYYPDKWFNVICMIRKKGIFYYCNLASPSIYDGEALKYIDYDLDVKVDNNYKYSVIDQDEYLEHGEKMGYSDDLKLVIEDQLQKLISCIENRESPFDHDEIYRLYDEYLLMKEEDKNV